MGFGQRSPKDSWGLCSFMSQRVIISGMHIDSLMFWRSRGAHNLPTAQLSSEERIGAIELWKVVSSYSAWLHVLVSSNVTSVAWMSFKGRGGCQAFVLRHRIESGHRICASIFGHGLRKIARVREQGMIERANAISCIATQYSTPMTQCAHRTIRVTSFNGTLRSLACDPTCFLGANSAQILQ